MTVRHVRGPGLDRLEEVRGHDDAIGPGTRVVTVHGHEALVKHDEAVVSGLDAVDDPTRLVLLGERAGVRYAARAVAAAEAAGLE